MFCQWVQAYELSVEDFRMILRTFIAVFPETTLWEPYQGSADYLLVGSKKKLSINYNELKRRLKFPQVSKDMKEMKIALSSIGYAYENDGFIDTAKAIDIAYEEMGTTVGVLLGFVMGPERLKVFAYAGKSDIINTDNHNVLEFSAPKHLYTESAIVSANTYLFRNYTHNPLDLLKDVGPMDFPALTMLELLHEKKRKLLPKWPYVAPEPELYVEPGAAADDDDDDYEDEDE